jgi:hypothetical protein
MSARRPVAGTLRLQMLGLILLILCPLFVLSLYGNLQRRKRDRVSAEGKITAAAKLAAVNESIFF